MGKTDRERRHEANLERINRVQLVCGTGDRMRVDHEGTVLERARMMVEEMSSHQATERNHSGPTSLATAGKFAASASTHPLSTVLR